ncbi:endolytic transglycosylase MltG [Rhodobacter sp. NTK016B]|uniref:endolytic transglycosylase MltG n=1 Tax=Rhodobacter sp. NTK016B TaxID=2759676 RepID=UPI001A8C18B3|nr:endolytic transglycosylase MltG [Rhodobacter sp. NTK016B]MBN8294175.1 endolytic transglycosylase MltG [Rhodobacter sp. NTK016B]
MWKHVVANALTLLIVGFIMLAGLVALGQRSFHAEGPLEQAICLRVEQGATLRVVADDLAEQGAVSSPMLFRVGAQYDGRHDRLRFGSYLVPEGASMEQILDIVTRGGASTCGTEVVFRIGVTAVNYEVRELDPATNRFIETVDLPLETTEFPAEYTDVAEQTDTRFRIVVAEGTTSWQIWNALENAEFLSGSVGEVPPEGHLMPDGYEVRRGADRGELLAMMQERQEAFLAQAWESRVDGLPFETPQEALILASIVEKETGVAEERRVVASVFINRLGVPMRLQTDPTVIYGITRGEGVLGRGLRRSELNADTPYNTYRIDGLPPTPIANPGRAAIEAVLDPEETEYLYFVADGSGGHAFATTLAEHNENVARWRRIEAGE